MNLVKTDKIKPYYTVNDSCYGTVSNRRSYINLDNGELAFSYNSAHIAPGTIVLCCVKKIESKTKCKQVCVESVLYDFDRYAA